MSDEGHFNFFFLFIFRATESIASVAFTMWLKKKNENHVRIKCLTSSEVLLNEVVVFTKVYVIWDGTSVALIRLRSRALFMR